MRRKDREITDTDKIMEILGECKVMRLGMCLDNIPYVTPLNFGYELTEKGFVFFFHCAPEGKRLDIIAQNPNVFIEIDNGGTLTAAEKACGWSSDYKSVMAMGKARVINDNTEKKQALSLLMKHQTGLEFAFEDNDLEGVCVCAIDVSEMTAKARITIN
ncbi:MAG: pyridoxamine 5'-phosphate oxidase family protein [Huintestinicola sp.]|uniref:pyridoxamine 5'-phosphate oxidase family protein n=1 Tax=Huintestinicola sp. TaxID=2981661 RepID=UPI003EFE5FB1